MTEDEKQLIGMCSTFCHVTTLDRADAIDSDGLRPDADESEVIRGPKRPKAVYFSPQASLNTALAFIGDRARDQERLIVFKVDAVLLSEKNCGPDLGWLSAHVGNAELEDATISMSLRIGGLACYEHIPLAEIIDRVEVNNPRYDGVKLV